MTQTVAASEYLYDVRKEYVKALLQKCGEYFVTYFGDLNWLRDLMALMTLLGVNVCFTRWWLTLEGCRVGKVIESASFRLLIKMESGKWTSNYADKRRYKKNTTEATAKNPVAVTNERELFCINDKMDSAAKVVQTYRNKTKAISRKGLEKFYQNIQNDVLKHFSTEHKNRRLTIKSVKPLN